MVSTNNMELKDIIFEGITIKPKNGVYKCPFKCGNPGYPTPKWKTEKGFLKHLNSCYKRPSLITKQENDKQELLDELEKVKQEYLPTIKYKIGDKIWFVRKIVEKDTHEWRFTRLVKVRYEPILRFDAEETTIRSINFDEPYFHVTLENIGRLLYFNNGIRSSDIMNKEDAFRIAKEKTILDKEYRDECSRYR